MALDISFYVCNRCVYTHYFNFVTVNQELLFILILGYVYINVHFIAPFFPPPQQPLPNQPIPVPPPGSPAPPTPESTVLTTVNTPVPIQNPQPNVFFIRRPRVLDEELEELNELAQRFSLSD